MYFIYILMKKIQLTFILTVFLYACILYNNNYMYNYVQGII